MDTSFELTNGVGVIRTASEGETFVGNGRVSGWGLLSEEGTEPDMLMAVNVTLRKSNFYLKVLNRSLPKNDFWCGEGVSAFYHFYLNFFIKDHKNSSYMTI